MSGLRAHRCHLCGRRLIDVPSTRTVAGGRNAPEREVRCVYAYDWPYRLRERPHVLVCPRRGALVGVGEPR